MRNFNHRLTSALVGVALVSMTIVAGAQTPKTSDVTVTGCLIQGATETSFVLDNARMNPKDAKEAGKRYLVVSHIEDMPLKNLLNHEITATGVVTTTAGSTASMPPVTPPVADKNLPVLTAKTIATVADRCTANAGRF